MLEQPLTTREINQLASTARDFEEIMPLPPLIALTGATTAVWLPLPHADAPPSKRTILADGGTSPGVFELNEAYRVSAQCIVDKSESHPTPDEIAERAVSVQAGWDDAERYKRAPHIFAVQPARAPRYTGTRDGWEAC